MKILEQLRKLAEKKQRELQRSEIRRRKKEWQYSEGPGKKIIQLRDYLREFVEYLSITELKIPAIYSIPNTAIRARFIQKEYVIRLDRIHAPTWISLTFTCHRNLPLWFSLGSRENAEKTARILWERGITFEQHPIISAQQKTIGFNFEVAPTIPVILRIEANKNTGSINLYSQNFEGLSVQRDRIHYENITEDWLDRFGRYILRQNATYRYDPVTDEEKTAIKKSVAHLKRKLMLIDHGFDFLLERGEGSSW